MTTNCGHCHTCGTKLREVLDGEEWCEKCQGYRRYVSHGWGHTEDKSACWPDPKALDTLSESLKMAHDSPGLAHLPMFGLVLKPGQKCPICELCGGDEAPIIGGRHLDVKFCQHHLNGTPL